MAAATSRSISRCARARALCAGRLAASRSAGFAAPAEREIDPKAHAELLDQRQVRGADLAPLAERATIARPYAKAAFAYARDQHAARWSGDAGERGRRSRRRSARAAALTQPARYPQRLAEIVIGSSAAAATDDAGRNFVRMLAENHRLGVLPEIAALFDRMKDEAENAIDVEVTSAVSSRCAAGRQARAALEHAVAAPGAAATARSMPRSSAARCCAPAIWSSTAPCQGRLERLARTDRLRIQGGPNYVH